MTLSRITWYAAIAYQGLQQFSILQTRIRQLYRIYTYGFRERINLWVLRRYPTAMGVVRSHASILRARVRHACVKKYALNTSWKLVSRNNLRTNQYFLLNLFCFLPCFKFFKEISFKNRMKIVPIDSENTATCNRVSKNLKLCTSLK